MTIIAVQEDDGTGDKQKNTEINSFISSQVNLLDKSQEEEIEMQNLESEQQSLQIQPSYGTPGSSNPNK